MHIQHLTSLLLMSPQILSDILWLIVHLAPLIPVQYIENHNYISTNKRCYVLISIINEFVEMIMFTQL